MAKKQGKSQPAEEDSSLLLFGLLALGALFLLKSSGTSGDAATDRPPADDIAPLNPVQSNVNTGNSGGVPGTVANPLMDSWGVPHLRPDTIDWANSFSNSKGQLFKALSDTYRLFAEEIDAVIVYEQQRSGNSITDVLNFFVGNQNLFPVYLNGYNAANPGTRIPPR